MRLLALMPGTRTAPGTGANTDSGTHSTHVPPRDIYARDSAFTRARDGYLLKYGGKLLPASSVAPDAYTAWLDHIWPAAACPHPVRLHGDIHRVDARTGEILSTTPTSALPDGVICLCPAYSQIVGFRSAAADCIIRRDGRQWRPRPSRTGAG